MVPSLLGPNPMVASWKNISQQKEPHTSGVIFTHHKQIHVQSLLLNEFHDSAIIIIEEIKKP
jgi:hypothetical protein